jgi:thiamine-phosphate pyrophosphorylase
VAAARRTLGDLQLGVWCGASRDQAMEAGEAGADYVAFGPYGDVEDPADPELVQWWVELMELPAVAEGRITPQNCAPLVQAGADFLAVGEAVWRHDGGPADAVRVFNQAIRTHAPQP